MPCPPPATDRLVPCLPRSVGLRTAVFRAAFCLAHRTDGRARPAFDPPLMVALLLFAYARVRSSREVKSTDVAGTASISAADTLTDDYGSRYCQRHAAPRRR
jgi:hypothetical protein